jgi:protein SCO1/2
MNRISPAFVLLWNAMNRALFAAFLSFTLVGCGRGGGTSWHADDIGGAMPRLQFSMIRANDGRPVTARDYRGRVVLFYFGYTNCPDICPTTLSDLAGVLGKLGADAADVRVLFVTVDPNRDTLAVLKRYVKVFAPEIDGLRGTESQIESLAHRYHVAYSVMTASPGHPYTVTHSSAIFFFDPKGNARLLSLTSDDTKGLAQDVERLIHGD